MRLELGFGVEVVLMGKLWLKTLMILLFASEAIAAYRCHWLFRQEYLFGPEFTITSQKIVDEGNSGQQSPQFNKKPLKEEAFKKLTDLIQEKCKSLSGCLATWDKDKHGPALRVTFKDDFYITIGADSAVLEVNAKPLTRFGFEKKEALFKEFVFDSAKEVGLYPHERTGQGHIHISKEAFEGNTLVFRNFFVDFQNRPELIYGALGSHLGNSPPVAALKPEQRTALQEVLKSFDPSTKTINDFAQAIESKVYTESTVPEWKFPNYYQAFNMTRISRANATLEIRSFRPQEDYKTYLLQLELLETWINKIKDLKRPLPYIRKDTHHYTSQQIVDSYYQLIQQLDLSWDKFRVLLPAKLRNIKPTNKYKSVNYEINN